MAVADFSVFVKKKKGTAVIRPPSDKATNGRLEITNRTAQNIIVSLPGNVFDNGSGQLNPNDEVIPVQPGKANKLVKHVHANADVGVHEFKVFVLETFSFAQGNSDPEFIIE